MTINLADNDPRASYAVAEGVTQSSFTVSFEFFDDDDLNVYVDGTLKALTTDYTVTGGDGSTGSISISVTGATGGSTVVITRDIDLERTTDFPVSGAFNIASLNTELDRMVAIQADLKDQSDRSLKLTDYDVGVSLTLPTVDDRKGTVLAFNSTTGAVEAGPTTSNVNSLADITDDIAALADIEDGTTATNAISGLASISSDVTTVSGISANVTTIAGISSDVTTVASISADVDALGGYATEVGQIAPYITEIDTVGDDLNSGSFNAGTEYDFGLITDASSGQSGSPDGFIVTVYNNMNDINALADIDTDITTVAGIASDVTSVVGDSSNISTVATDISNVNSVATNISNVNSVATNSTNINAVAADATDIGTVASDIANVNTVAGISSNVTTVAGISSDVTAVAGDATDIGTVATNIADINTAASNVTEIQNASTNAATATTKAAEAATSATNAATSETNAATSETNAATSETNAATSATNAATSATAASNAQTAAEAARDSALASFDSFDDRYLGTKTSDPSLDNDGNALVAGALYFNTTSSAMKVYTGSAWVAAYVSGTDYLAISGGTMTGTLGVTTVDFGDWTITESGGSLYFATGGTNKMKLDASGNLDVAGSINSDATIT